MKLGVIYPGDELPMDTEALDAWVDAVVAAGFDHVVFGDHILGVDPSKMPPGWDDRWPGRSAGAEPYSYRDAFREPLVLFGYLAARTELELVTGVLVSPQRQTAVLAKQAAEVDLLSRGRLRLVLGLGWNPVEYAALGEDFAARGRRLDEQIEVLRRLWTEDVVTFEGEFDRILAAGLMSLPLQRPIPLWTGAHTKLGFERAGRAADGCLLPASVNPVDGSLDGPRATIASAAAEAGRDPESIALEGRVQLDRGADAGDLEETVRRWGAAGVEHLYLDTRYRGRSTLAEHLDSLAAAGAALARR